MAKGPPPGTTYLELVTDPEGSRLVAVIEFDRLEVMTASLAPDGSPATYYTVLQPKKLIMGAWDFQRQVTVQSGHYVATSQDKDWIGVIVKDPAGKVRWFTELFVRNGRVYEGGTEEFFSTEADAPKMILAYLKENGVR